MAVDLDKLRKEIDECDNQLLDILNKRMEIVKRVGELKRANKTVIYRPEREKDIIERLSSKSKGLLKKPAIEAIFLEIFAISRNLELPERIAYLGPEGSFTHQAAESRFGAMSEYMPISSIESVFDAVATERARFGVIPIENNQEGIVAETIDLLGQTELKIVAEIALSIHFAFGTREENLANIKKIYSKDIGFKQCKKFLAESFNGNTPELIPVNSTSKAAKLAMEEDGAAALCPHIAARLINLPILFDNVEDSEDNFTRFLIISKDFVNAKSENDKTSILAKTADKPGSLVMLLQDFYDAGVNLTKIESRPAKKGKNFKYWFFIDIDGHFEDANVARLLQKHQKDLKWLGSYVKMC